MSSDFPDGSRSNVAKDKQDLAMLLSHPLTLWDTVQLSGNEQKEVFLYNQDLNHIYVVNAICCLPYGVPYCMFFCYHNQKLISGGNPSYESYIPIDYSQNVSLLYGDNISFDIKNYDDSAQWFIYYILVTSYPLPSTLVRRPQAYFTLNDYSVAKNVTVTATNDSYYSPESYEWNWGDGSAIQTIENPTHKYTAAGVYDVSLTVRTGSLSDTYITRVTVT